MIGSITVYRKSIDSADKGYEDAAIRLRFARKYERLLFLILVFHILHGVLCCLSSLHIVRVCKRDCLERETARNSCVNSSKPCQECVERSDRLRGIEEKDTHSFSSLVSREVPADRCCSVLSFNLRRRKTKLGLKEI